MHAPPITFLRLSGNLFKAVYPRLQGRVFHVSLFSNLGQILGTGNILPNQHGQFTTTFGSSENSFFRNRGCVSLFDYRSVTQEELNDSVFKCSPMQPAYSGSAVAIFMLADSTCPPLLSWQMWKEAKAWSEMVVPYVEMGHHGPLPLSLVDEIMCVEVIKDRDHTAHSNWSRS
jgi:hypothetical protein